VTWDKCPGSKQFTQPTPEFYPCPWCGGEVEIWSDEPQAKCPECGREVTRERVQGCIDHCEMARECLGAERYERLVAQSRQAKAVGDAQAGPTD
jgi:DNA-directed RNA polymerase subunit RPC12/RpoP